MFAALFILNETSGMVQWHVHVVGARPAASLTASTTVIFAIDNDKRVLSSYRWGNCKTEALEL
jgi:hypothetical protein